MKFNKGIASLLLAVAPLTYAHNIHWSYESPEHWGDLSDDYQFCKTGVNQSPVDIRHSINGLLAPLTLQYNAGQGAIVNNGHTIQVSLEDAGSIKLDDDTFTLRQFHFHTPSENRIQGKTFPLEVHFVHTNPQGQLAVVAVMVEAGHSNPAIAAIINTAPAQIDQENKLSTPFDLTALIPQNKAYYRFSGSLTTPPCSEGVRWVVMKDAVTASKAQLASLVQLLGERGNSRPVQPLNGRLIVG